MKKIKISAALAALLLLSACRSDDEPVLSGDAYLSFGVPTSTVTLDWETETRATRDELPAIPAPKASKPDNIGVWGFNDRTGEPVFSNRKMIYRYGAEAADYANLIGEWDALQEGNEYPYANPEKWHPSLTDATSRYKFFAYSPFIATGNPDTDDVIAYREEFDNFEAFIWHRLPRYSTTDYVVNQNMLNYNAKMPGGHNPEQVLLMDHLYSRLRLCFILGPRFGELREIHIKSLTINGLPADKVMLRQSFTQVTDPGGEPSYGNNGELLYTSQRNWEPETSSGPAAVNYTLQVDPELTSMAYYKDADFPVLDDDGALLLNAKNREHYGYLPYGSLYAYPYSDLSSIEISVVYDVYDKEGVLLRKDDTATNTINLSLMASGTTPGTGIRVLEGGRYYDVRIALEPKFLFVLSDNDVNPDGEIIIH